MWEPQILGYPHVQPQNVAWVYQIMKISTRLNVGEGRREVVYTHTCISAHFFWKRRSTIFKDRMGEKAANALLLCNCCVMFFLPYLLCFYDQLVVLKVAGEPHRNLWCKSSVNVFSSLFGSHWTKPTWPTCLCQVWKLQKNKTIIIPLFMLLLEALECNSWRSDSPELESVERGVTLSAHPAKRAVVRHLSVHL